MLGAGTTGKSRGGPKGGARDSPRLSMAREVVVMRGLATQTVGLTFPVTTEVLQPLERTEDSLRGKGGTGKPHAYGIEDCIGYGGHRSVYTDFADAFGSEGS